MIPKIIHRFYMSSDNSLPDPESKIGKTFYSQDKLKDYGYEIKTYNANNFDMSKSTYLLQAYALKKWAFVSDYIRLYVLYNEGGIWLDTDVEVFKSFDELLNQKYFFSTEYPLWANIHDMFSNRAEHDWQDWGVLGVEPHNILIKEMLEYYNNQPFIDDEGWIYDKLSPNDYIHEPANINNNFERILRKLNIRREVVSDSLEQYTELVNNSSDDIIYVLNTKWMTWFYYDPINDYMDDIICSHRRHGSWLDNTQQIYYLQDYDEETKLNYYNTINKYKYK